MFPRFILPQILQALKDSPIILIVGARQTGKTTLVKVIAGKHHPAKYLTMDEFSLRSAAAEDPRGFLANFAKPVIIDEIQLSPALLPAIKMEVDRKRKPGRFILTGSANVLTLPRISESLAGRIEIFTLHPLSQGEITKKQEHFIDRIFGTDFSVAELPPLRTKTLWKKIITGGFPEAIKRKKIDRREAWFRDYITTIIQRDVRDLSQINGLLNMPRLLQLLAARTSSLLNVADISRSIQMPQTSLRRYLAMFQAIFLIKYLPAWSSNLGKRMIKMPKLHFIDSGLVSYLSGISADNLQARSALTGALFENYVFSELVKQSGWSRIKPSFFHFRSLSGVEVDLVLEDRSQRCVGIEIKLSSSVRKNDFKGLIYLKNLTKDRFLRGFVIYLGNEIIPFGEELFAIPLHAIWQ